MLHFGLQRSNNTVQSFDVKLRLYVQLLHARIAHVTIAYAVHQAADLPEIDPTHFGRKVLYVAARIKVW